MADPCHDPCFSLLFLYREGPMAAGPASRSGSTEPGDKTGLRPSPALALAQCTNLFTPFLHLYSPLSVLLLLLLLPSERRQPHVYVYSSFLGHQTSLIAFFAQTLAEAPRRGLPDFWHENRWRGPSQPLALAPLRDGVAASADGLIVQQSQR